jgi:hypothetical protein
MLVNLGLIIIFANQNNSEKNLGPIAQLVRAPDS